MITNYNPILQAKALEYPPSLHHPTAFAAATSVHFGRKKRESKTVGLVGSLLWKVHSRKLVIEYIF